MHYDGFTWMKSSRKPVRSKPRWDYAREPEDERRETSLRRTRLELARDVCVKPGMNVINVIHVEKGRSFISSPQIQVSVCQATSTSHIDADKQHFRVSIRGCSQRTQFCIWNRAGSGGGIGKKWNFQSLCALLLICTLHSVSKLCSFTFRWAFSFLCERPLNVQSLRAL